MNPLISIICINKSQATIANDEFLASECQPGACRRQHARGLVQRERNTMKEWGIRGTERAGRRAKRRKGEGELKEERAGRH